MDEQQQTTGIGTEPAGQQQAPAPEPQTAPMAGAMPQPAAMPKSEPMRPAAAPGIMIESQTLQTEDNNLVGKTAPQMANLQDMGDIAPMPNEPLAPMPQNVSKRMIIITAAIVGGLIVFGVGGYIAWKSMSRQAAPTAVETPPAATSVAPVVAPVEQVATTTPIAATERDSVSVLEQDLSAFNIEGVDAQIQAGLTELGAAVK